MTEILSLVKAVREKLAEGGNTDLATAAGLTTAGGLSGGMAGGLYGGVAGIGYGAAKGRPIAGTGRGMIRGGMTGAGMGIGGTLGSLATEHTNNPVLAALATLSGAAAGGIGGWKLSDKLIGKKMKEKQARDPSVEAFSSAVQGASNANLQGDALNTVGRIGLTGLGVGMAGRGLLGLVQTLRERGRKKTRSGPTYLPLPYLAKAGSAVGDFFKGNDATSSAGIPWFAPAAMIGGVAGAGLGWHGMDKILNARRQREMESELESAKDDFTKAMLAQYSSPIKVHPDRLPQLTKRSSDDTMTKLGETLDRVFAKVNAIHAEKTALDMPDLAGQAAGGYGVYAGLSGLLTGALVYDRMRKRSRQAVLDKAIQMRQRRRAALSPNAIYAIPEPVTAAG